MMVKFGSPPLWITISPAVVHSRIFVSLCGKKIDIDPMLTTNERAKLVAKDPVAAAKFFNVVINAFTSQLLGYKQSHVVIFGKTSAYYECIEEQATGTLHIHMLVWLAGFKTMSQREKRFR